MEICAVLPCVTGDVVVDIVVALSSVAVTMRGGIWDKRVALEAVKQQMDIWVDTEDTFIHFEVDDGLHTTLDDGDALPVHDHSLARCCIIADVRLTLTGLIALKEKHITLSEQVVIASCPQHDACGAANARWLGYRVGMITGSIVGAIYGTNPYSSATKQLLELLWNSFRGNAATRWGNEHEDDCEAAFADYQAVRILESEEETKHEQLPACTLTDVSFEHAGLCVCRTSPFLGMSPDAFLVETWSYTSPGYATRAEAEAEMSALPKFVHTDCPRPVPVTVCVKTDDQRAGAAVFVVHLSYTLRVLVEYKCPYKQRTRTSWRGGDDIYPVENIAKAPGVRLPVPSYYYSQVQYGMQVLGVLDKMLTWPTHCWVVVWAPACSSFDDDDNSEDFVHRTAVSGEGSAVNIETPRGTIQATRVAYNAAYANDLLDVVTRFWRTRYMPALWQKNNGYLAHQELPADDEDFTNVQVLAAKRKRNQATAQREKDSAVVIDVGPRDVATRAAGATGRHANFTADDRFENSFVRIHSIAELSGLVHPSRSSDDDDAMTFGDDFVFI